ncbi:hypothetical protein C0991_007179 [Blastosporella zonata]|nr:hypothetical protein C0991_007179 [Blastosporella zonata]
MLEGILLHLCPKEDEIRLESQSFPVLPPNKDVEQLFADMFLYLTRCTLEFIEDTHVNGAELVQANIEYIIAHPNGWKGAPQARLRRAAVLAGLVTDTPSDHSRIHFVEEGEAALHFCLRNAASSMVADEMKAEGKGILVVDAGGGTVDLSAYELRGNNVFHEVRTPKCIFQGSIFVTNKATEWLRGKLSGSIFGTDETIKRMTKFFDQNTKHKFENITDDQYIQFGGAGDKDPDLNIWSGGIGVDGRQVATFFEPSLRAITNAIIEETTQAPGRTKITTVLLVGGFSASSWLYKQLKLSLRNHGLRLVRPDAHLNKAVADGAVSFYVDHLVKARRAKYTYGIEFYSEFDPYNLEHIRRSSTMAFLDANGLYYIDRQFQCILNKDMQVAEEKEFSQEFYRRADLREHFENPMKDVILCYQGDKEEPLWIDKEEGRSVKQTIGKSALSNPIFRD